jgi:RNA-dependent RNA polymerase
MCFFYCKLAKDLQDLFLLIAFCLQLISHFTPSPPWKRLGGKINYPEDDRPDNLTPEQLEKALFKKFLKARFQTFRPMPTAANYWLAHMDRYLTLKDNPDPQDEMSLISESIDDLIEIFYRALDADKTGEEVCFPHRHMYTWMSVCILFPSQSSVGTFK